MIHIIESAVEVSNPKIIHCTCRERDPDSSVVQAMSVSIPTRLSRLPYRGQLHINGESKLLSGFPFIDHGNSDNNLDSLCIFRKEQQQLTRGATPA